MAVSFPETIETERLNLRPFRWDDIDDLMYFAVTEECSRYIRPPHPYRRENAGEFLADRIALSRPDQTIWCIERNKQMIGDVGFAWHTQNRAGKIAYSLSPEY